MLPAGDATPERRREANGGMLFDLVVTCAGVKEVVETAFETADRGGTILFFAPLAPDINVEMPFFRIWRDQIKIVSTYAGCPVDIE